MTKRDELNARRVAHVSMLRELMEEARCRESFGSAANLARQIADLEGLMAPAPAPVRRRRPPPEIADPIEAMRARLSDTVSLRMTATDKGSNDSAARLLRLEVDLRAELDAAVRLAGAAAAGVLTDADLIEQVASDLLAMPPAMRRSVMAIVQAGERPAAPGRPAN